jgi:uncharacterized integral membrane protein (TIGR00698 family)
LQTREKQNSDDSYKGRRRRQDDVPDWLRKVVFVAGIIFCLSPWGSPPVALALGLFFAFTLGNPFPSSTGSPTRLLLQLSVVLLGFGMNLSAVVAAGRRGFVFTVVTIFGTLAAGYVLGRALNVDKKISSLISAGTAICGGSAIGAVGPTIRADREQMSVALVTVFVLNANALIIFPPLGRALGMSEEQFGLWAAIAIHDTSSVVGAAQAFGEQALATATTVKLARALWIAPIAGLMLLVYRRENAAGGRSKVAIPWFIGLFLLAAAARTYAPDRILPSVFDALVNLARAGMTVTLFLIGVGLTPRSLRKVGLRPLGEGVVLWAIVSAVSLAAVLGLL